MNRFYINVGQKNVKPRCVKREYQLFVDQLCIVYMHIGPSGFPQFIFREWYLYRPIWSYISGGSRFWGGGGGGGALFWDFILHPPLRGFSWSHYKSLYLDFLGFWFAPPLDHFSWSHYKCLCLDFWDLDLHTHFFSEATIKVYSWMFYLPRRRRPGTGDIATPPVRPSVPSVRLSVRHV